ncbi:MAG: cysteine hydrolase family protein [Candidatus Dormibacteraeota bacterium]|jgi:nicotinamidase-related amidase|nr:cysteine hydrolase family protein [Candidatus Dormibacteraeota bacterium]
MSGLHPGSLSALVVIDVQRGFDAPAWGQRNNLSCEDNVATLISAYRRAGQRTVFVRHDSRAANSPLAPGTPGNRFKEVVSGEPDLLITKHVHSAFYGTPDLDRWLQEQGIQTIAICGIATDHCCETTARMAGDLGYDTLFVLDATHTFDRAAPGGEVLSGDLIARAAAASLDGEFARVVTTEQVLERLS